MKYCIKICVPDWEIAKSWGDYHMALALKSSFEKRGDSAFIQIMPEWYNKKDAESDVVIQIRGLNRYKPSPKHINLIWIVSHPDKVALRELEAYDLVFVASAPYSLKLQRSLKTKVLPLFQCTDQNIFYPSVSSENRSELLFVGNSRKVFRKVIKDLLPTEHELNIWGNDWESFVDKRYIKGDYFPNEELRNLYSSCKVLLNDHWDDMRDNGFISNRIFDALACKAFIVSDCVEGIEEVLPDSVVTFDGPGDLKEKLSFYLSNEEERLLVASRGYELVRLSHTYDARVAAIAAEVEKLVSIPLNREGRFSSLLKRLSLKNSTTKAKENGE